jgi:hypothetical protein
VRRQKPKASVQGHDGPDLEHEAAHLEHLPNQQVIGHHDGSK